MDKMTTFEASRSVVKAITTMPADRHPAYVYLGSLGSDASRRSVRSSLESVARMLTNGAAGWDAIDWTAIGYQHVAALRSQLVARNLSPATVNRTLASVKGVIRQAWLLGWIPAETYQRVREVKGVLNIAPPHGHELSHGELSALFRACAEDASPEGARDSVVLALLYGCGLRRAELCALDLSDFENGSLRVRGKGHRIRLAPVDDGALDALEDWLKVRGHAPGALIWPSGEGKGRKLVNRHMSPDSIWHICEKRAAEAGVPVFRPHDLRRSFVSHLLDAKVDLSIVSKLAGHAQLQTTMRYDMRPEAAKREGARMLHVPYRRRKTVAWVSASNT